MADQKQGSSHGSRRRHRGRDLEGNRRLEESSKSIKKKMRDRAIACDQAVRENISKMLGFDLEAIYEEARAAQVEIDHEIKQDMEQFRREARSLAARERRLFNEQVEWAIRKGNLKEHLAKAYHNPCMLMKLCSEYHGSCSPPAGMTGGAGPQEPPQSEANYFFKLYDEPFLGVYYVDTIHPYCRADAGSRRTGYASAWVEQRLTYTHAPPATSRLYNEVELLLSGFGYGESASADVIYFLLSSAADPDIGGFATLSLSITIEQDYVDAGGHSGTTTVEAVRESCLAGFISPGAIWLFAPSRRAPPIWGSITLEERLTYPTLFLAYGQDDVDGPLGGPVRVHVDFRCEAEADHRRAEGEIGFRQSDEHAIKVHQVALREAD